jgi:5-formyltetrahydrofolate cyclo-ligase
LSNLNQRKQIRTTLRQNRRQLTISQRSLFAKQLHSCFFRHIALLPKKRIALYLSHDGEIDLTPLLHTFWKMRKSCYLPVILPQKKTVLFAPYKEKQKMIYNSFAIAEPKTPKQQLVTASQLDLLLLPLVAFDRKGNRLGMGGGYYDRCLAYLKNRSVWKKPYLLGVAYSFQEVPQLPSADWDIPLHAILTEKQLIGTV